MNDHIDDVLMNAASKLNIAKRSLQGKNKEIRDDKAFAFTSDRIMTSIENFANTGASNIYGIDEAILAAFENGHRRNFSNVSASDMASVRDVDVVDIAIASTVASHGLTYFAMERSMDSANQQISFQGLKAVNGGNGYNEGDVVYDPRTSVDLKKLDFGRDGATLDIECTAVTETSSTAYQYFDGSATLTATAPSTSVGPMVLGTAEIYVGSDKVAFDTGKMEADTNHWTPMVLTGGSVLTEAAINLNTGVIRIKAASVSSIGSSKVHIVACWDRIAEGNGAHTLKLKPFIDHAELVSTENRVILQSAVEVQAQMNKILRKNARYGIDVDFGKRAIDQIITLYTKFRDTQIIRKLLEGANSKASFGTLDLEAFALTGGNANVKNDRISAFFEAMCSDFVNKTDAPVSAIAVDQIAGSVLASDSENFVADAAMRQRRDGLIGHYKNVPIVRNSYLNGQATSGNGIMIAAFKSTDGMCAPVATGDYLPPYSTLPAVNANNPGELAQALFSQTATKCVAPGWCMKAEVKPYVTLS